MSALSLNTLKLLQGILLSQTLSVSADDGEIEAVLTAKREIATAVTEAEGRAL
jgi:hypothetical protein